MAYSLCKVEAQSGGTCTTKTEATNTKRLELGYIAGLSLCPKLSCILLVGHLRQSVHEISSE